MNIIINIFVITEFVLLTLCFANSMNTSVSRRGSKIELSTLFLNVFKALTMTVICSLCISIIIYILTCLFGGIIVLIIICPFIIPCFMLCGNLTV